MVKYKYKLIKVFDEIVKFFYYLRHYQQIRKVLNDNFITNVKVFNFRQWRIGCGYLIGEKDGEKVFLKIDTQLLMLSNEKLFYDIMEKKIGDNLLKMHFFHDSKTLQVACFSYVENSRELTERDIIGNPNYLIDLINILKKINKESIIHRDVKLDNFLISDGKLKIIDFFFCQRLNKTYEKLTYDDDFIELNMNDDFQRNILIRLGDKYRPDYLSWNDFLAMSKVLADIKNSNDLSEEYDEKINNAITELRKIGINENYTLISPFEYKNKRLN